ncbi:MULTISPECIES: hypothetical protein [Pseudomonas]|uniref:Uncharacterized protein n=1 Tax=Pseudomonas fluorescens TaxID=294 RepID=A0A166QKU6_PSEFL|nr:MULTISPECIES: hypothetical protein [Pseudomonas]KZN20440.1 hypothetical protein A1D17_02555 [Pseudomonas fluorescens]
MRIDSTLLVQGQQHYQNTMSDDNRAIRDPIITPFVLAMTLGGYVEIMERGACVKLRACPICPVGKGNYSSQYQKDGMLVWGCPHCQNITES